MPQLLTVGVKRPEGRPIRIWVPVLPAMLLLSPLLILAALAVIVACLMFGVSLTQAFGTGWQLFWALPGTQLDIHDGSTTLLVSIR